MKKYLVVIMFSVVLLVSGCSRGGTETTNSITAETLEKEIREKNLLRLELEEAYKKIANLEKIAVGLEETNEKINALETQLEDFREKASNLASQKPLASKREVLKVESVSNDVIKYVYIPVDYNMDTTNIIGENIDGIIESREDIQVKGTGEGEYVRYQVAGSIYDFQLIKVEWDDDKSALVEDKILYEVEEIRNQAIVIETYLPCGMAMEKVKWKDSKGAVHEGYLSSDGYGFGGTIIYNR